MYTKQDERGQKCAKKLLLTVFKKYKLNEGQSPILEEPVVITYLGKKKNDGGFIQDDITSLRAVRPDSGVSGRRQGITMKTTSPLGG